jgi:FkbM family methyltransferase
VIRELPVKILEPIMRRFRPKYYESRAVRAKREAFYRQFVNPDDIVFDVGANHGNRTETFLALGARVVAIDPQAECVGILRRRFGSMSALAIEPVALGAQDGEITLHLTSVPTIATVSPEFIEATHESGRFSEYEYSGHRSVRMTTLDALVQRHGEPAFIKIDVEGFEPQVLSGLSQRPSALRAISFEFTPELFENTQRCLRQLVQLGASQANYSLGESMTLALESDVSIDEILPGLASFGGAEMFGDVYVRWIADR